MLKRIICIILSVILTAVLIPLNTFGESGPVVTAKTASSDQITELSDAEDIPPETETEALTKEIPQTDPTSYSINVSASVQFDRDETTPDLPDVYTGDTLGIEIAVSGGDFYGADFTFTYDAEVFDILSAPESEYWTDNENGSFSFRRETDQDTPFSDGEVLGEFIFSAVVTTTTGNYDFAIAPDAYIKRSTDGSLTDSENKLSVSSLGAFAVATRLKSMTANVDSAKDLIYKSIDQELILNSFTAQDTTTGNIIDNARFSFCVLSKAEISAGTLPSTYSEGIPKRSDAGDYTVFYKVEKEGFAPLQSYVNVTIQKHNVRVIWNAPGFTAKNIETDGCDFKTTYADGQVFPIPTAEYDGFDNTTRYAAVTLTSPDAISFSDAGTYTFTAEIDDNYNITNKTCIVLIDGAEIVGYTLENVDGAAYAWYDANDHDIGVLKIASGATANVNVSYSIDNGATWYDTAPKAYSPGNYTLLAKLTKKSCHEKILCVDFKIKSAEYYVEKSDYVAGWDIVYVYTNTDIPGFTYNDSQMYDISRLGYKYNPYPMYTTPDSSLLVSYKYVYAIVIYGNANMTKVCPSNEKALPIDTLHTESEKSRYDVNQSGTVDINDLVAVQAIYNVDKRYMNASKMAIVLKADINGDKKVDTSDCSTIIANNK